jgi:type IV secretion system protein VirB3
VFRRSASRIGNGITADTLFVAATRPAMAFGVPYGALLLTALVTLESFLMTRNLLALLMALPMHALAWLVCLAEPRCFDLIAVWGATRARANFLGRLPGRVVTYGPLSGRPRRAAASNLTMVSLYIPGGERGPR